MAPWWARQLAMFGSISPTSSSGAALWIRTISEWNSITAEPSLAKFLDQGIGPIVGSRLAGLGSAIANYAVVIGGVVLVPFILIGAIGRLGSRDFTPWFVYTGVVFLTATILYPLHVPGGAFIHSAIGLAPHAAISIEGVLIVVGWIAAAPELGRGAGRSLWGRRPGRGGCLRPARPGPLGRDAPAAPGARRALPLRAG
jgi:hypothetical protein